MQFQSPGKPPVGIVFDADLGNAIDDALALAMLFGFQGRNESRVLSVSTTKSSLNAAIFADVLVRFYTGEPGPFAPAMPIGLSLAGNMAATTPMLEAVAGNAKYPRTIVKLNGTLVTDYDGAATVPPKRGQYEPDRGPRPDAGYIAIQHHGGKAMLWFKEITLIK